MNSKALLEEEMEQGARRGKSRTQKVKVKKGVRPETGFAMGDECVGGLLVLCSALGKENIRTGLLACLSRGSFADVSS
ncbi:hypothetical protein OO006_01900 [Prosthecochloris sp. SCSIO W1101]|uniref:hypothetical protein n=1 Tax=Prosthecochloris sp. SCSIO W1101 TaxID=2992242 RepID=UPI00223E7109|nr:hypothetical protein [Prosthecochloris sp. SCSIO W1101]UZJ41777.1 hypothetical protein OO006_01900 [Prosthecochloris sp. SCSIO W1101]